MEKLEYNGYTNYETWNTNLHYSDSFYGIAKDAVENLDTDAEDFAEEFDAEDFVESLASAFEELVAENEKLDDLPNGIVKDFAMQGFENIDWEDIVRTHLTDFDVLKPFLKEA